MSIQLVRALCVLLFCVIYIPPALSYFSCVEVPPADSGASARRKSMRSACTSQETHTFARNVAADNVGEALASVCKESNISRLRARQLCTARGLSWAGDMAIEPSEVTVLTPIRANGQSPVDMGINVSEMVRLGYCAVGRDLESESERTHYNDNSCGSGTRWIELWKMRGRCGVICY